MPRLPAVAALAVASASMLCSARPGRADDPGDWPRWTVQVETSGGSRVTGTLRLKAVKIEGDLGILEIKAEKIKEVHFSGDRQPSPSPDLISSDEEKPYWGDVVTSSGSTIKGTLAIRPLKMETDLGTLTLAPGKVRAIVFQGTAGAPSREEGPKPGALELKPEPKAETPRPSPIPRYLTHPSALRVTRIGAVRRPPPCPPTRPNPPAHESAQSPSRNRRVIEP